MPITLRHIKPLYSPVFVVCCITFVIHQLTEKHFRIAVPAADNYLDNFLATPILLTLLMVERRILFGRGHLYTLASGEVVLATLIISVVGEWLFPLLSSNFTFDWLDFLFYTLGSCLFWYGINSAEGKRHPSR